MSLTAILGLGCSGNLLLTLCKVRCEPYYELPMGIARLRALVQFRVGSHALPVEQGRYARPALPCHLRRCSLCSTQALGDELHYVFDCPHFSDIRSQSVGSVEPCTSRSRLQCTERHSVAIGVSILPFTRMLMAACAFLSGILILTRRLLAIASKPFSTGLRT